ncbi:DMT family transporter [Polycladomyces zharkentensis]
MGVMMLVKNIHWDVIIAHGIAIFFWASAFAGIRAGLKAYSPEHLALLRLLIASIVLAIYAWVTRMRLPEVKDIPIILITGFLGFSVYHIAVNLGETTVSAGVASLIVSLAPIFTGILASVFLHERFGFSGWVGTLISFFGASLISIGTGEGFHLNMGALLVLLGTFSESVYFVIQKPYLKKYGSLAFTSYAIWAGTLFVLVFTPGIIKEIESAPMSATLSVVYLGIFPTVISYLALAYTTHRVGASKASTSLYLTPVLAFVIAWIWLGEIPTWFSIIGGIITILGVLYANKNGKWKKGDRKERVTI